MLYVALTRAKRHLHVSHASQRRAAEPRALSREPPPRAASRPTAPAGPLRPGALLREKNCCSARLASPPQVPLRAGGGAVPLPRGGGHARPRRLQPRHREAPVRGRDGGAGLRCASTRHAVAAAPTAASSAVLCARGGEAAALPPASPAALEPRAPVRALVSSPGCRRGEGLRDEASGGGGGPSSSSAGEAAAGGERGGRQGGGAAFSVEAAAVRVRGGGCFVTADPSKDDRAAAAKATRRTWSGRGARFPSSPARRGPPSPLVCGGGAVGTHRRLQESL